MAEGWIKVHRSIRKHWIWEDAQKLKWWLDILLQANHQGRKILLGNDLLEVERGSFHTSEIKLAERWKVNRKTVRRFLELLEKDNMISMNKSKKGTTLKVSNYADYQGVSEGEKDNGEDNARDNREDNTVPTEGTTQGTDKSQISPNKRDTNKNDKECNKNEEELNKNYKNDKKYIYTSDSNEYRLAEYLYKHILKNNPKAKEPNFQKWAKQFDYILRIDERPLEEVKELIKFSQQHDFWFKNILSPEKLRKQYDTLILERKDPKPNGNKPKGNFNDYDQRAYDFDAQEKELLELNDTEEEVNGQALLDEIRNKK